MVRKVETIALVGVGLIGGSFAAALKSKNPESTCHIIGVDKSAADLKMAQTLGIIDSVEQDISKAVKQADLVFLAVPVLSIPEAFAQISDALDSETIVTDVGSVKGDIVEAAKDIFGVNFKQFVPAHPIAGREQSGVTAASGLLFERHKIVLTPLPETCLKSVAEVSRLWCSVGAQVEIMDVQKHDRVLSITSHLPHVLAYTMMEFLVNSVDSEDAFNLTAGGFYDFTRTASSDAKMWTDICLMNKNHIVQHIAEYQAHLTQMSQLIEDQDANALCTLFENAKKSRARIVEKRQPLPEMSLQQTKQ